MTHFLTVFGLPLALFIFLLILGYLLWRLERLFRRAYAFIGKPALVNPSMGKPGHDSKIQNIADSRLGSSRLKRNAARPPTETSPP